ncbi:MAG: carboxypeptidase-like regulatory domain-containing protein [Bacteroidota bacterium]
MKKNILFFSLLLISISSFSQSDYFKITGQIVDVLTRAPMQGASVFAQNTTFGTATDAEGNFTLILPNGGYDLAVTYTDYETKTRRITTADATDKILMSIQQKDKALEAVAVVSTSEVKDGWEKYGSFFIENFIGKTPFSQNCILANHDSLRFYFSKRKNRLKVLSSLPVEIINNSLGYKIKYTLDSFTYDYGTQASIYTGYPLFEEIQPSDEVQRKLWQENRVSAYNGSLLHFMRSIYNKNMQQEGFEIQFIVDKNTDAEKAIAPKDQYGAINYNVPDSMPLVEFWPNQPDMAVLYKKEKPQQEYLDQNNDIPKDFQLSVLNIYNAIAIEQNGYYYDQYDVTINGYWTFEKVADMLPYDYKPTEK